MFTYTSLPLSTYILLGLLFDSFNFLKCITNRFTYFIFERNNNCIFTITQKTGFLCCIYLLTAFQQDLYPNVVHKRRYLCFWKSLTIGLCSLSANCWFGLTLVFGTIFHGKTCKPLNSYLASTIFWITCNGKWFVR